MPYEIEFSHLVTPPDPAVYINECCFGGDVVSDQLLPAISDRYQHVRAAQEDWGWFIWFRDGAIRLAVDIFCDEPADGSFRIHLTSREHRRFWSDRITDTPELEELKDKVDSLLSTWIGGPIAIVRLDEDYARVDD